MEDIRWSKVILSWFVVGCILSCAAFFQVFYSWLGWILLVPVVVSAAAVTKMTQMGHAYRWQVRAIVLIWLLHAVQLLTPETGFDALWYHLPVAEAVTTQGGLVYVPELYQSANPIFSDLFFTAAYAIAGSDGAQLMGFIFGLLLVGATFRVARVFLNTRFALWSVLFVSLLQVVAWQSSSFYIDLAKAFWEVTALWVLLQSKSTRSGAVFTGLLLGASLASKLFSLLLLPVFMLLLIARYKHSWTERFIQVVGFVGAVVLVAAPFYFFTLLHTGSAVYAVQLHLTQIEQIGGESSVWKYVWQRLVRLPLLPFSLAVVRDYVGPLVVIGTGIAVWFAILWKRVDRQLSVLSYFSLAQLGVWWFVPPLSTRYALAGFVTLTILGVYTVARTETLFVTKMHKKYGYVTHWLMPVVLWSCLALMVAPRLYVTARNAPYILGVESQQQYLQRFIDGNIDSVMYSWYGPELDKNR